MDPRILARGGRLLGLPACALTFVLISASPAPGAQERPAVTIAASDRDATVAYGDEVRLSGTVEPASGGRTVTLEHAPGGGAFRPLARTATGADGSYRFKVRPRQSGAFRAVADGQAVSDPERVSVRAWLRASAPAHVLAGRTVTVAGQLRLGDRRRGVVLDLLTRRGWRAIVRAATTTRGDFKLTWRPARLGGHALRLRFGGDRLNAPAASRLPGGVKVYRAAWASWYGPGLYGNRLACGGRLSPATLGVAHRRLPCGTRVTMHYRGRTVTVRVVDRGPYVGGREWDLTAATKRALGFPSTGVVWTTR